MQSRAPFLSAIACLFFMTTSLADDAFVLVVMDPLSKPLSCDCVKGYAQRDYELLGKHLESSLGKPVKVVWFESLAEALGDTAGKADLVIGKHSVVLADVQSTGYHLKPLAQLTGKDGSVTQKGLVVVRAADKAKSLADLNGYRVLFGPEDAEEKSSAPAVALEAAGVKLPKKRERFGACSEAAAALLEIPNDVKAAAVISSYAEPLLEGCGSIDQGDLRVVGESQPVPFITAFVSEQMDAEAQEQLLVSLVTAGIKPEVLVGMETLAGFLPWDSKVDHGVVKKKSPVQ
ncbi:MAG: PhnD/SsuA/transferrin family substrate-binding protein [Rubripirellula sp.]